MWVYRHPGWKSNNPMTRSHVGLLCIIALLQFTQNESIAIGGYVNQRWVPGPILIANPLNDGTNTLQSVLRHAPNGTSLSLWDASANDYSITSTKVGDTWTENLELALGTGALVISPSFYTNTYVGAVMTGDGDLYAGYDLPVPPSPFAGQAGLYLLGSISPISTVGDDVFLWAVGRVPMNGESVTILEGAGTLVTHTYTSGIWSNGEPELPVAQSAFFNIQNVNEVAFIPEPSSFALLGLALITIVLVRRGRLLLHQTGNAT